MLVTVQLYLATVTMKLVDVIIFIPLAQLFIDKRCLLFIHSKTIKKH